MTVLTVNRMDCNRSFFAHLAVDVGQDSHYTGEDLLGGRASPPVLSLRKVDHTFILQLCLTSHLLEKSVLGGQRPGGRGV